MERYNAEEERGGSLATGGVIFAGIVLIIQGIFHVLIGIAALVNDDFFVTTSNYTYNLNLTGWGIVHLVLGGLLFFAGFGVLTGKLWAFIVGIVLAALSIIDNFFFIPFYPLWSLMMIALGILVIWALTIRGPGLRRSRYY